MTRHEDIWREQCDATATIHARYFVDEPDIIARVKDQPPR